MVRVIEAPRLVQAAGSPPKMISEYIGRQASATEPVSVAMMKSPPGWSEPGQTPEFDEYTLVLSGSVDLTTRTETIHLHAGQAAIAPAGEWIQYSSPQGAEYIAICLPAFHPDIVHRDGEFYSEINGKDRTNIVYDEFGPEGLDLIEDLWNELKEHHVCHARHFREQLLSRPYAERKADILKTNEGRNLLVHLAKDKGSNQYVGFCISSASPGEYGEIESIYIQPAYRSLGIGTTFMNHACRYLEASQVSEARVRVCEGNEDSFRFYEKFGFHLRRHLLLKKMG
jgi:ribosomal protein S18 acetylase RimI-like enzyme/mannose-6-phosphate isomerase-like protein (cupin superfamily)